MDATSSINSDETIPAKSSTSTNSSREPSVPCYTSSGVIHSNEASASTPDQEGACSSIFCGPCSTGDGRDKTLVVGYCSDCEEYYCQSCYLGHSRNQTTKDHSLMDEYAMTLISKPSTPSSMASMNLKKDSGTDDPQQHQFHFHRDIDINEAKYCVICGMTAIYDNELVIIDAMSETVKLVDIDLEVTNVRDKKVDFDTLPMNVTTLPNREVAVTFPHENLIRILSTSDGISVVRAIEVCGKCIAVDYCNDKFYVIYSDPVKCQILSLAGEVKKTIQPDAKMLHHCESPRNLVVHPDESKLYMSDCMNDAVLCMDMSGAMLAVYKDAGLEDSECMTFSPFNSIFLCNRKTHIVYEITDDLTEASAVLGPKDGLDCPMAICFYPGTKSLYIGSANMQYFISNTIKQFKYC